MVTDMTTPALSAECAHQFFDNGSGQITSKCVKCGYPALSAEEMALARWYFRRRYGDDVARLYDVFNSRGPDTGEAKAMLDTANKFAKDVTDFLRSSPAPVDRQSEGEEPLKDAVIAAARGLEWIDEYQDIDGLMVAYVKAAQVETLVSALHALDASGAKEADHATEIKRLRARSERDTRLMESLIDAVEGAPDRQSEGEVIERSGQAVILNGAVVISVALAALPMVVEGAWASGNLQPRYKVTNVNEFAAELVRALNDEEEDGTTRVHRMFDSAIDEAINQGAEGIEEHENQDA